MSIPDREVAALKGEPWEPEYKDVDRVIEIKHENDLTDGE